MWQATQNTRHEADVRLQRAYLIIVGKFVIFHKLSRGFLGIILISFCLADAARELAEMVKKMPKLDWPQRESVKATLRRNVRRLLAKYGYPPDLSDDATTLVVKQAELSTAAEA